MGDGELDDAQGHQSTGTMIFKYMYNIQLKLIKIWPLKNTKKEKETVSII